MVSPCVRVHRRTLFMNSSLLLQQDPVCLVCLSWMVLEMGSKWSYSCCFVGCCFQDLFKTAHNILVYFPSSIFSMNFVSIHVVHPYSRIYTAIATSWKNLILLNWIDQTYTHTHTHTHTHIYIYIYIYILWRDTLTPYPCIDQTAYIGSASITWPESESRLKGLDKIPLPQTRLSTHEEQTTLWFENGNRWLDERWLLSKLYFRAPEIQIDCKVSGWKLFGEDGWEKCLGVETPVNSLNASRVAVLRWLEILEEKEKKKMLPRFHREAMNYRRDDKWKKCMKCIWSLKRILTGVFLWKRKRDIWSRVLWGLRGDDELK